MIKKILGTILLAISVVGGAVAADFVKNRAPADDEAHSSAKPKKDSYAKKDDGHGKTDKKKKGKKDDKGHSVTDLIDGPSYLKFKRQFVVPVMNGGEIEALVIMNLNYELDSDAPENIYTYEPKLRDAIMRELLSLSDQEIFGENLTTPQSYEMLRSTLLRAGKQVVPEGIRDVLILDLARQDQ